MSISISGNGSITGATTSYSFDQSVSIGGTLTYEDVTNIDSVGVVTARSGVYFGSPGSGTQVDGNSNGIGIGSADPYARLDVFTTNYPAAKFNSSYTASSKEYTSILLGSPNTNQGFTLGQLYDTVTPSAGYFHITPYGLGEGENFSIKHNGNVGIGLTNPNTRLEIAANNNGLGENNTLRFTDTDTSTQGNQQIGKIEFYSSDVSGPGAGVKAYIGAFSPDTSPDAYLDFATQDGSGNPNPVIRMRIKSDGKIGIGTASPTADGLHIVNSTQPDIFMGTSTNAEGFKVVYNDTDTVIGNVTSTPLRFVIGNDEKARIDSTGRLLVGTPTSPSLTDGQYAKIHLVGNTAGASGDAVLNLGRGILASSGMSAGTILGILQFTDSAGAAHATIKGVADAATGSNDYPGRLVFSTTANSAHSPTERMRIGSNGQASHFGDTTVITSASALSAGTAEYLFVGQHSATTINNGTDSIRITTNGNITNTNDSYGQISDIKLKENIVDAESQWDDFKAVRFRKFNFKEETGHETHTQLGVIAQELELVSPGLVYETPDQDEDGNDLGTTTKAVKSSVLVKKALVALQEAMERIETLETQNADLLTRVSALEG